MAFYKFFKAQISSFTATAVDFIIMILLVELAGMWYLAGSVLGTIFGGITNYTINRFWSFHSTKELVHMQAFRYFHIWMSSIILNALGMWFLTSLGDIEYIISKIIVSVVVGFGFNYPLQKKYVFENMKRK
ncbi:MAG TPA: GtrA family protein [Ignavibacteria bacterium]|nr:GtrA family protein [Ignavibacteria bacterium]